jgi:hypothetical protein
MFPFHIAMAYVVAISGIGCFVTRAVNSLKMYHIYFARIYILSMLWCTASSLLIHNTGLPLGVLISFIWVLGGLTIGWIFIMMHQYTLNNQALESLEKKVSGGFQGSLKQLIQQEKNTIANSKSLWKRMLSWKALHGMIMFTSWINITGRLFFSDQNTAHFDCHTYPVYKPLDGFHYQPNGNTNITLVPIEDPNYKRLPWANGEIRWGAIMLFGPMIGSAFVGLIFGFFNSKKSGVVKP